MSEFKSGDHINILGGSSAVIEKELGHGTQGIVYSVKIDGKPYALKWYTQKEIRHNGAFEKNLIKNIDERMSPDPRFLWPLYLTEKRKDSYGYIMDLIPQGYSKFPGIVNNKYQFLSYDVLLVAALNLVSAFRVLHNRGLSYQDLNKGSFFIKVKTGDVLICDCDNVSSGGEGNPGKIKGTQGYMAPEIVTGKAAHPSTETDRHSLAVVLFYLFIHQHPLYGKKRDEEGDGIPDIKALEGTNPIFIFDPHNDSNRPTPPDLKNAPKNWAVLPPYVQELFEKAFGEGLGEPAKRPTELQWQQALLRFRDEDLSDLNCLNPHCTDGGELSDSKISHIFCKKCGTTFDQPARLYCGDYAIPLLPGKKIYAYHIDKKADFCTVDYKDAVGEVLASKKTPGSLGIRNTSKDTWMVTAPNGENITVMLDEVMTIKCGSEITFKGVTGRVVFQLSTEKYTLSLYPGKKIYGYNTKGDKTPIAEVVASKHNPHKWGLRNLSHDVWSYTSVWGEKGSVRHDEVMSIARACQIDFGSMSGKISG